MLAGASKRVSPVRRSPQLHAGRRQIARIDGVADGVLQDGRTLTKNGLFTPPRTVMSSPIAEQLGCALEGGGLGVRRRQRHAGFQTYQGVACVVFEVNHFKCRL